MWYSPGILHTLLTSTADNVSLELALLPLIKKMEEVKKQKHYKHGEYSQTHQGTLHVASYSISGHVQ